MKYCKGFVIPLGELVTLTNKACRQGCARLMSRELNSDSNESSQSRVGRENQGYESSQSRITLIVI